MSCPSEWTGILSAGPLDVAGDGAPLRGIQPAVGPPAQVVGDAVRVLDAKAFEMHHRVAVGHVVAIGDRDRTADTAG